MDKRDEMCACRLGFREPRLIELAEEELGPFLRDHEIGGLNVTIPYKQAVIPYLDFLTPRARGVRKSRYGITACL